MLEGLSPRMAAYADANGHTLYSVIWYSSTSEVWGESTKLQEYIKEFKPTYEFISLGANELSSLAEDENGTEITCQFCNSTYKFTSDEIKELLKKATQNV